MSLDDIPLFGRDPISTAGFPFIYTPGIHSFVASVLLSDIYSLLLLEIEIYSCIL
jgi:hypothetical protein